MMSGGAINPVEKMNNSEGKKDKSHKKRHPLKSATHRMLCTGAVCSAYLVPIYQQHNSGFLNGTGQDLRFEVYLQDIRGGISIPNKISKASSEIQDHLSRNKSHTYLERVAGHKFRITVHKDVNPSQYSWQIYISKKDMHHSGDKKDHKEKKKHGKKDKLSTMRGKIAAEELAINDLKPENRPEYKSLPVPTKQDIVDLRKHLYDEITNKNSKNNVNIDKNKIEMEQEMMIKKEMWKKYQKSWVREYAHLVSDHAMDKDTAYDALLEK